MKSTMITAGLLAAMLLSLLLFRLKMPRSQSSMQLTDHSLETLRGLLPLNATIACLTQPATPELYTQLRYLMAPRILSPADLPLTDTTLLVYPAHARLPVSIDSMQLLWQQQDGLYAYLLLKPKTP